MTASSPTAKADAIYRHGLLFTSDMNRRAKHGFKRAAPSV